MKLTELTEKTAEPDGEQMDIPQEPLRPSAWISPFGLKRLVSVPAGLRLVASRAGLFLGVIILGCAVAAAFLSQVQEFFQADPTAWLFLLPLAIGGVGPIIASCAMARLGSRTEIDDRSGVIRFTAGGRTQTWQKNQLIAVQVCSYRRSGMSGAQHRVDYSSELNLAFQSEEQITRQCVMCTHDRDRTARFAQQIADHCSVPIDKSTGSSKPGRKRTRRPTKS